MKKNKFSDFLKKSFGKNRDEKSHSLTMLAIYGVFILIMIIVVRIGNTSVKTDSTNANKKEIKEDKKTVNANYNYSYSILFDDVKESYLGKKVNEKEKFTYIKNGISNDYAILNDTYLIFEDDGYKVTNKFNNYFKYCDREKIIELVDNLDSISKLNNSISYTVSNVALAKIFNENLVDNNKQFNTIVLTYENELLVDIELGLSNYISSVLGENHNLVIKMSFADINMVEDFNIDIN